MIPSRDLDTKRGRETDDFNRLTPGPPTSLTWENRKNDRTHQQKLLLAKDKTRHQILLKNCNSGQRTKLVRHATHRLLQYNHTMIQP